MADKKAKSSKPATKAPGDLMAFTLNMRPMDGGWHISASEVQRFIAGLANSGLKVDAPTQAVAKAKTRTA